MATQDEAPFVVPLRGPGWRAELEVAPPTASRPPASFDVPISDGGSLRRVSAQVRYTTAINRTKLTGWATWHVKIYRCENRGDADALRRYLRRQANDIRSANAHIEGPARSPILPPWAVVPVQIITGDNSADPGQHAPPTEPGARAEEFMNRIRATLPPWFGVDNPAPELFLLAFSPQLEMVDWESFRTKPGIEHLADFRSMARGLDTLHKRGTAHCDIKPDNVCRYNSTEVGSGYVLIDADAATRMDPPPKAALRTTPPYIYKGVQDWYDRELPRGRGIDPGRMRAQDRFGFALVVLGALAGRDWVETDLLTHPDDESGDGRPADDRDAVASALSRHWREPHWEPLVQAAALPFGPEIEEWSWSVADWVEQLVEAQRECARLAPASRPAPQPEPETVLDRHLHAIRAYARAVPATRPQQSVRAYEAVARRANAVAARAAVSSALVSAILPIAVVIVVIIGALVLRK